MSSIVLSKSDAYINIGAARAWREHLLNHTFSAWIKTACQQPACLVSLTNDTREVFSVDINTSPHPSRDGTQIVHKYQNVPPTRFINSPGARWQRAPVPKTLKPVKLAGTHGAILGNLAGGVRVAIEDDHGHRVVAETPLPILADDSWHFLQVTVEGNEVVVSVDGNHLSVFYTRRDPKLEPLDWNNVGDRVVYPSHDLLAARFSLNAGHGVQDHYCGMLADVAVEIGHPGGHKLHWWVTDNAQGTIVWDRGSGATQHPQGIHLNLCSCAWDTEDFPATSLLLNGYEGRTAEVPELDEAMLELLSTVDNGDPRVESPPQRMDELSGHPGDVVSSDATPDRVLSESTCCSPFSQNDVISPVSAGSDNRPALVLATGHGDEPQAPISQTMNREYFERVQKEDGRQSMSFSLWICTRDRDPAIVFTAPFRNPVHLILNLDCKPSVALVNGVDAFVSQCDVTDGKWHHIRWIIDPKTGASLFMDNALAAWQYVALHVDEDGSGPIRGRSASVDGSGGGSPCPLRPLTSIAGVRSRGRYPTSGAKPEARASLHEALQRRSITTSMLNLHSDRKSLCAAAEEVDGDPQDGAATSWRRARSRNSITFMESSASTSFVGLDGDKNCDRSVVVPASTAFAIDEEELLGDLLQDLEDADERVTAWHVAADKPAEHRDSNVLSPTVSNHFLFLSIKKRREIIQILTDMMQQRKKKTDAGAGGNGTTEKQTLKCFTLGSYFMGEIREVVVKIGNHSLTWRYDAGAGRSVTPALAIKDAEDAELSMMSLLTPQNGFGGFGNYRSSGHRFIGLIGTMQLCGRMTLFPKTILPYSCPVLDDNTTLALGGVRVPLERQSTGIDVGFFVKLKRGSSYGHVVTVESVCLVELQQNRLNVFVVGTVDQTLRASTLLKVPDILPKYVEDEEKPRLINCYSDTTVFEDLQWHHIRITIPTLGDYRRIGIAVDEIPMESTASLVVEQFPNGGLGASRNNSRMLSVSSRRGTVLLRPSLAPCEHGGEDDVLDVSGLPLTTPKSNASTPQAMRRRRTTTVIKESSAKVRFVLHGLTAPVLPATPQAAHDVQLARVMCGGCGFSGSVVQLHVVLNGQEYLWPLRDSCRSNIARIPPFVRPVFLNHASMQAPHPSIPLTPSRMECEGDASVHTHWQPTALPSKALHFDGHSSFVSSVNLRSNFHMSNLKRFAVSLWVKAGASSDPTVSIASGCLVTIHDIQRPTTESSCGIFTHTRVDEHTHPRKRNFAPYVTSFLLVDSCARALCLETTYDLYDGLWHKLQWVVYDAPSNESHVFIDDVAVPVRVVCSDYPREFTCRKPVLNLGARNEGDNDVTNYFVGEIRNFKLAREVGDDILSWQMTEGEGDVLNDEFQRITGCVWAPEWIFTPFPPMTPIVREDSVIEVSPVTDLEASARVAPMWFSFSIKSNSNAIGSVWNVVSADRCVLGSFIANEGGDHERRCNEPGTHTLRLQRVVRKAIASVASSVERSCDDRQDPLFSPPTSPKARRSKLLAATSDSFIVGELDSMACSGMASSTLRTPNQRHRKIARRAELKELLKAQTSAGDRDGTANEVSFLEGSYLSDSNNAGAVSSALKNTGSMAIPSSSRASSATKTRFAMVLEERVYQYHHKDLCDGKWHKMTLYLPPDPTSEHAKVFMDELDMQAMHLSTTNLRELPDTILDDLANMPSTNASSVQDRTPLEILRDQISWGSVVLGKSSVTAVPALHCCIRNFAVLTDQCRNELLFVPFASTMDMVSPVPRDVAATGVQWELSVPPRSSIALGNDSYILVPPLANINLRSFEISFRLRAVTTEASCILEFGSVTNGYLCIMLNQDAFGEHAENSIRVCLCDAEGRDLHASCFLSEDDYEPTLLKRQRPIDDDQWHTIVLRVVDAACNNVLFEVDGIKPQMRYANCGAPCLFKALTEGGTIGALLDVLDPTFPLAGSVKNFTVSNITNGPEVAQNPELPMEKELLAIYEATSGFASILTDRSGNRNHAMAVNPVWKTDLQTTWGPMEIPGKATDVFSSCHLTVSRWSNNPSDGVEKNRHSDEVVMEEFPEDGWASGARGPQWISIDLGSSHTVFSIEIDVFRASSSKHEVYLSRSNLSKSATFNGLADPKRDAVPQAMLLETIQLRPASPKTMRVKIGHPLFGVRWLRIVAVDSIVPVAYSGIRIVAIRGDYCATRKRSMSEVLGRTLSSLNAKSQAGPMLSMFPDTLVANECEEGGGSRSHPRRAHRNTIIWGGEADDQPVVSPFVVGDHKRVKRGAARTLRDNSPGGSPSTSPRVQVLEQHVPLATRKTSEEQERELKLIFYTQDVERTGYISLSAFMEVFHKVDITGLLSDEQVLSFLRDAGVIEPRVNFEQFVKVIAHIETW